MSSPTPQTTIAQYLCFIHQQMLEPAGTPVETPIASARLLNTLEITLSRELRRA